MKRFLTGIVLLLALKAMLHLAAGFSASDSADYLRTMIYARITHRHDYARVLGNIRVPITQFRVHRNFNPAEFPFSTEFKPNSVAVFPMLAARFMAKVLNPYFYKNDVFDIRYLSFLYFFCLLGIIYFTWKKLYQNTWLLLGFSLCLSSVFALENITLFNSFFQEPVALLGIIGLISGFLVYFQKNPSYSVKWLNFILISGIIIPWTKVQYVPVYPFLIIFLIILLFINEKLKKHWKLLLGVSAVAMAGTVYFAQSPQNKDNAFYNLFHTIYDVIGLRSQGESEETRIQKNKSDLVFLGLEEKDIQYVGMEPYEHFQLFTSELKAHFLQVSRLKLLWLTLTSWRSLTTLFNQTYLSTLNSRFPNITYVPPIDGQPVSKHPKDILSFHFWRDFVYEKMGSTTLFVILFILMPFSALAFFTIPTLRRNQNSISLLCIAVFLWSQVLCQSMVVVLGDGFYDHPKHLWMAKICFDMAFLLWITWVLSVGYESIKSTQSIKQFK